MTTVNTLEAGRLQVDTFRVRHVQRNLDDLLEKLPAGVGPGDTVPFTERRGHDVGVEREHADDGREARRDVDELQEGMDPRPLESVHIVDQHYRPSSRLDERLAHS